MLLLIPDLESRIWPCETLNTLTKVSHILTDFEILWIKTNLDQPCKGNLEYITRISMFLDFMMGIHGIFSAIWLWLFAEKEDIYVRSFHFQQMTTDYCEFTLNWPGRKKNKFDKLLNWIPKCIILIHIYLINMLENIEP